MKHAVEISDKIYWIGVNDMDTDLFEGIWPLPRGVAYNAYLIDDEKVAVIDTVKKGYLPQFIEKIQSVLGDKPIDYLVVNHMEPDHSGSVKILRQLYPNMEIVANQKTLDFLKGFYGIEDGIKIMGDKETIDLGDKSLTFYMTPMVHWPETMMTYENKTQTLFSADAFGGFGVLQGGIFDDEVDLEYYENEILRYYSNIVAKYSPMVQRALAKLDGVPIKVIASTHGAVFRKNPSYIVERYDRWSKQETEKGVVIVYSSMYGHTQTMAEAIARSLACAGVDQIRLHNVSRSHLSYMLTDIWKYKGLILGSSTYNMKMSPYMDMLVSTLDNDKLKNRVFGVFGSYSWSGGAVKALREYAEKSGNQLLEPVVEAKHAPDDNFLDMCRQLGKNMAESL
jgi:flavorubredoxin